MRLSKALTFRTIGRNFACVTLVLVICSLAASQTTLNLAPEQPTQVSQPASSALEDLRKAFRTSYNDAIAFHSENTIHKYPVITQDLLNMTLIRSDGKTERYSMKREMYFLMANTSHPLLTIYAMLSKDDFGTLSKQTIVDLESYRIKLSKAAEEVKGLSIEPK